MAKRKVRKGAAGRYLNSKICLVTLFDELYIKTRSWPTLVKPMVFWKEARPVEHRQSHTK